MTALGMTPIARDRAGGVVASQASLELPIPLAGIRIVVPGVPTAKGRPRVFMHKGMNRLIATTPPKTRRYEDLLRLEAGRVMEGQEQLEGPLRVTIRAYVQPRKVSPNTKQRALRLKAAPCAR
jgi:hypothetical protein